MKEQTPNTDSSTGGILEPVSQTDFFENYWEQQPLHIARSSINPFESLISISAIETLLSTNQLFYPAVQLSHAGQSISLSEYTDGNNKIVGSGVVDRYRRGSTIVLSQAHMLRSELMALCRHVQSSFMMRCQTNVYLSPAGNQGFNPHFDTHDVFILQISGRKTFHFYSGGTELPTSADRFNSEIHQTGSRTESIEMSAGDTLYIPRGVVHDAVADQHEPSLHVTLGVYPVLMHDLLQEISQICLESDSDMRTAVPQKIWMTSQSTTTVVERLTHSMQNHINADVVAVALSRLRDAVALDAIANSQNLLQQAKSQPLTLSCVVSVNHAAILQLERIGGTLKLRTFGAVVEFNDPLGASVEWLVNESKSTLAGIPGLDHSQRTAMVEKLNQYDVVTVQKAD